MTKSKAIFVGVFSGVFAGLIVYLLFSQMGIEGEGMLQPMLATAPFIIGLGLGGQVMALLLKCCGDAKAETESAAKD